MTKRKRCNHESNIQENIVKQKNAEMFFFLNRFSDVEAKVCSRKICFKSYIMAEKLTYQTYWLTDWLNGPGTKRYIQRLCFFFTKKKRWQMYKKRRKNIIYLCKELILLEIHAAVPSSIQICTLLSFLLS